MSVAPVTAATGDGDSLLDLDDGGLSLDDGISVAGEDGVSVSVDDGVNASVAGDDGVQVGVGGDEPVEASVAGDDGVQVGVGGDEPVEASVAGTEVTNGAPTDVVSEVDSIGGGTVTDSGATEDVPVAGGVLDSTPGTDQGLNLSGITGLDTCELTRISGDKLPTDTLPGLDTLPSGLVPVVPTNLLTTGAVASIATGYVPNGCEVVDLEDPQVDPTDPQIDPDYTFNVLRLGQTDDGAVLWMVAEGTLDESGDGPSARTSPGAIIEPDTLALEPDFVLDVGEGTYGSEEIGIKRNGDDVTLNGVAILVGKDIGANVKCTDLTEFEGDLSTDNLADMGPCEYELVGIPTFVGPEQVFGLIESLGSGGPPVDPGALPIPVDELLNL